MNVRRPALPVSLTSCLLNSLLVMSVLDISDEFNVQGQRPVIRSKDIIMSDYASHPITFSSPFTIHVFPPHTILLGLPY